MIKLERRYALHTGAQTRRKSGVTSVLRSKTLAQGQFTCPEQDETGSPQNQGFCGAGDIIEAFQMEQIEV